MMIPFFASAGDDFTEGEELFRQDKVQEAIPYFLKAMETGGYPKVYNYLALCYHKTGDSAAALEICEKGMSVPGTDKKTLAYNAGNIAFSSGAFSSAEKWYSTAITASPSFAEPYLNRANSRLSLGKLDESCEDYRKYLELAPDDEQRPQIESLILLIAQEKERLEKEKLAALEEEKRLKEEEERLAAMRALEEEERRKEEERLAAERALEEERRKAEAARIAAEEAEKRRKLLENVAASLKQTESENMLAGAEGTLDYEYETELE
ncbi:MAG: tetratricopeptide repeat protein [Treponema sp.]|nr:tetratricopeptide repeat protein [Treponema sp.]